MPGPNPAPPEAGLCASCVHVRVQRSARGSRFVRCARAEGDPAWPRYPQLPVAACRGHEESPAPDDAPGEGC